MTNNYEYCRKCMKVCQITVPFYLHGYTDVEIDFNIN